jgi:hypothetical protein
MSGRSEAANLRIAPSELCDDQTFLRRIYIDATGQLPASEEVAAFVADQDGEKRRRRLMSCLRAKNS